jgi:alkylglycerol monooxygenase
VLNAFLMPLAVGFLAALAATAPYRVGGGRLRLIVGVRVSAAYSWVAGAGLTRPAVLVSPQKRLREKRLNVIVYAIPVFVALMAAEFGIGLALGRNVYRLNDAVGSLTAGILSQISGVFMLALSVGIYILVYNHFSLFALRVDDWRVWVGALIAYDFFYYWNHRIDHEVGLFWAAHVVHHQSEAFNLSTALRQPSSGVLLGWIFYLPMAIAGVPPVVFVAVGLIDLLYQFWIHTELVGKLGWFDRVFASPSNHRVHHGVNDLYLDKNYGGILIIWDRLFGTYEDEVEPAVYGVRGGLSTFDPISANLSYYATMADLSWRATDWRDKIRVWFAPPGWVPANLRRPGPQAPYDLNAIRRYDPPAGRAATILVFAALVAMIGSTAGFLMAGPSLPLASGVGVFLSLAASLWAMGSLLDGRISVLETLYVFAASLTCSAYALGWPGVESLAKPAAMALLIVSFATRDGQADIKRLVTAALVASLAGDTLLLSPSLFAPGLFAFLVAHGFYIAAFSRGVGFLPSRIAAVAIGAFAALVFAYVWPGVAAGLKIPVVVYAAMVACDAAQAAGRATVLRDRAAVAVGIGGVLFMISDMTIALMKFGNVGWPADQWTLPTYYLAQGLIAFYVLPRARPSRENIT